MKIKFLGTAAAEGMPAVFCNCDTCARARSSGGKDIRTRNQVLVDDNILIDFPVDTYFHSLTHNIDLSKISDVFITHSHPDHCSPIDLITHGSPHAHKLACPTINVYGNKDVIKRVSDIVLPDAKENILSSINLNAINLYDKVSVGNVTFTPLKANHTKDEDCFVYLISKGDINYLQLNDSGILDDSVYKYLQQNGIVLDGVAFDCTYGYAHKGSGRHMGFLDAKSEQARMQKYGIVKPSTKYILTHFSHNSNVFYEEFSLLVAKDGYAVAYDGLEIEF